MNYVGLVGRITKDPTIRQFNDGKVQTSFSLAINRNYKNQQGTVDVDFVQCVAWGKLAERITNYCGKGSLIGVSGRLQSRSYVNKENKKVYLTEVIVDNVRFYLLKNPGHNMQEEQGEQEQLVDFELPTEEEALPIT